MSASPTSEQLHDAPAPRTQPVSAPEGARVAVGLSGGVDSAASALLLKNAGLRAEGITLSVLSGEGAPSSAAAIRDAQRICERIGIPFHEIDRRDLFDREVIDPFCTQYLDGKTPNPCIMCNRTVKFASLHAYRVANGLDFVATGHYAQIEFDTMTQRFLLKRAIDRSKDQSYVLYGLTQEELAHTLFPLGGLTKSAVRALALEAGFSNANKPESQDICFIPEGDYASFIERYRHATFEPGPILNKSNQVIGMHHGLARYTIGQRKGIGVAVGEPLYVYAKDPARNALIVGTDEETLCTEIIVDDFNLISRESLEEPLLVLVKAHYRQKGRPATIEPVGDCSARIVFDEPQRACAPGQAAVAYQGDYVLGGGTIRVAR